ncbi:hypothetical protein D3C80_1195450 [compost metagenome]
MNAFCGIDTGSNVFVLLFNQQFIGSLFRNVAGQSRKSDNALSGSGFKNNGCILSQPDNSAFFGTDRKLEVCILNAVDDLIPEKIFHRIPIIRMNNTHGIFPDQIFILVSENPATPFIQIGEMTIDIGVENHILRIFNQRLIIGCQSQFLRHILSHNYPNGI